MITRIKELREYEKLSQANLAKIIGYSQGSVSQWELGTKEPTASALTALADCFCVSIDYLLCRENDIGVINIVYGKIEKHDDFQEMSKMWKKLNPDNRNRILERAETLLDLQ